MKTIQWKHFGWGLLLLTCLVPGFARAETKILYDKKFNTVRLVDVDAKITGEGELNQPVNISKEKVHNMLGSLTFDKGLVIMKDREEVTLFDKRGLDLLSPYISQAFAEATPEQMVQFLYILKAPYGKVIRNDRLIIGNMWVRNGELFVRFDKLYAKIFGDYQRPGNQRMLNDAKDVRVSLAQQPGQTVIGQKLVALRIQHDYYADLQRRKEEQLKAKEEKKKEETEIGVPLPQSEPAPQQTAKQDSQVGNLVSDQAGAALPGSTEARLQELDELKKKQLISDKEYKAKRKEILEDL